MPPLLTLALDPRGCRRVGAALLPRIRELIAISHPSVIPFALGVVILLGPQVTGQQLLGRIGFTGIARRRAPSIPKPRAHGMIASGGRPASISDAELAPNKRSRYGKEVP